MPRSDGETATVNIVPATAETGIRDVATIKITVKSGESKENITVSNIKTQICVKPSKLIINRY